MKRIFTNLLFILPPIGLYIFFSCFLKHWIVDDAGISFTYAKNLANGYGLTTWPGEKPVEGFSNFSWTILIALLHIVRLFDPILSPKILALFFVAGSFMLIQKIFYKYTGSQVWGMVVNIFLAINAPLVIWNNSGLENSLYLFMVLMLGFQIAKQPPQKTSSVVLISIICFLIAITRPEGFLYSFAFPLINIFSAGRNWKKIVGFASLFILLYGGFLLFRWFYFHDWVPNTFHTKYHKVFSETNLLDKLNYLTFGIGGRWGKWLLLMLIITLPFIKSKDQIIHPLKKTVLAIWTLGTLQFFILPADWMGELRFASIFITFTYLLLVLHIFIAFKTFAERSDLKKIIGIGSLSFLLLYSGYHFYIRMDNFSKDPTIPFSVVKSTFPDRFNEVNQKMGWKNATILLPDVGATLYYSEIKVIDAAGLCDATIPLKISEGEQPLRDYVLNDLQPSIIHLHGRWKEMYNLGSDKRFLEDYMDVSLLIPGASNEFYPLVTCDYIRMDLINDGNREVIDSLFNECIRVELKSPAINFSEPPE